MPSELSLEVLSSADLPRNVALSQSVGWPDTEAEWRVIYRAALVLGATRAGELLGQGGRGPERATAGRWRKTPRCLVARGRASLFEPRRSSGNSVRSTVEREPR